MEYKPLNMFVKQTDELKELIKEHPDYQIVVVVGSEVVADDDYVYWYAPELRFCLGEILDCEQEVNDEKVYTDRDDLEEDIMYMLSCDDTISELTDEEFDKLVEKEMKKYEPYWKDVIKIVADI